MPSTIGEVARKTEVAAPCSGVFIRNSPDTSACCACASAAARFSRLQWRCRGVQTPPGIRAVRGDAVGGPPPVGLDVEERISGLGLAVGQTWVVVAALEEEVVKDDRRRRVTARGNRHDPRPVGGGEGHVQARGECEVAMVIDSELGLPALGGGAERGVHHAGVVDEHVEGPGPPRRDRIDLGSMRIHGRLALASAMTGAP